MIDDIVFYGSLLGCISLGSYYKKIDDMNMKRNYGAGLGLLVACLLCGHHVYHSVLIVWGNIVIIKCCEKRYLHHVSLGYTWIYLMYLHFNLPGSPYPQWFYQTIALRVVGLAFEVHLAAKHRSISSKTLGLTKALSASKIGLRLDQSNSKTSLIKNSSSSKLNTSKTNLAEKEESKADQKTIKLSEVRAMNGSNKPTIPNIGVAFIELDLLTKEPTAVDIITYSYFFIGLHKGPYYRWKIFEDHFKSPFAVLGDCRVITEQKIKKALICSLGYLLLRMKYAPEVYYDDAFYQTYDNDFRYLYSLPQLVMYFLHYQMVMMLCTSVCTETGFGVYPAKCLPVPGHGPTTGTSLLKLASTTTDVALEQEYNFSMLKCFENERILFGPKMRDTVRAWDMPTQYWFWVFIYKNALKSNKEVRSACSFLAWLCWKGPSLQNLIISVTMWIYLNLEAEYTGLYNTDESLRGPWNIGYSIMRLLCLIYLTPCLIVEDASVVFKYYNSIWWLYHIVLILLMIGAVVVFKRRELRIKRASVASIHNDPSTSRASASKPSGTPSSANIFRSDTDRTNQVNSLPQ